MTKLADLPSIPQRVVASMALGSGLAVVGATAAAFTTTAAIPYTVDGVFRSLAAQTNTALVPLAAADLPALTGSEYRQPAGGLGFYTQPAGTTAYLVLCVNAAGAVRAVQGTFPGQPVGLSSGVTAVGDGNIPDIPQGVAPFAVIRIVSGGAAFTPGVTALTGVSTFFNVSMLPVAERL